MKRTEPFTVASYVVVTLFGLFCLIPLWMIVAGSFTDETTLSLKGYSLFPDPFSVTAYEQLFAGKHSAGRTVPRCSSPWSAPCCRSPAPPAWRG